MCQNGKRKHVYLFKMIRYQLPTFVKRVLAPRDDFGMQKKLANKHKKWDLVRPPPFGKFSHLFPVFGSDRVPNSNLCFPLLWLLKCHFKQKSLLRRL